jgi:hypothetical protein
MTFTIKLDPTTCDSLRTGGFSLYAFRSVTPMTGTALPAVWGRITSDALMPNIEPTWTAPLTGYFSTTAIAAGNLVFVGASSVVGLGYILTIGPSGETTRVQGGAPASVTFGDGTRDPFTCGMAQPFGGISAPFCAFALEPNTTQGAAPGANILLLFSTADMQPGTIVDDFPSPATTLDGGGNTANASQTEAVIVKLTRPQALSFSFASGWTWAAGAWGMVLKAGDPIVPHLIPRA